MVHDVAERAAGAFLHLLNDLQRSGALWIDPGFPPAVEHQRQAPHAVRGMDAERRLPDDGHLAVRVFHGYILHGSWFI